MQVGPMQQCLIFITLRFRQGHRCCRRDIQASLSVIELYHRVMDNLRRVCRTSATATTSISAWPFSYSHCIAGDTTADDPLFCCSSNASSRTSQAIIIILLAGASLFCCNSNASSRASSAFIVTVARAYQDDSGPRRHVAVSTTGGQSISLGAGLAEKPPESGGDIVDVDDLHSPETVEVSWSRAKFDSLMKSLRADAPHCHFISVAS